MVETSKWALLHDATVEAHEMHGLTESGILRQAETSVHAVVVIDMVGYSRLARLLEENAGAAAVAELNRQIQVLIQSGLAVLPAGAPCLTLTETGDGAILLFDSAPDAHLFAEQVLTHANADNLARSNKSARRWFRIGIALGELTRTSQEAHDGYAGITIANATRLETAAQPSEIVIDLATYGALPAEMRRVYGRETMVRGKRAEAFRVHKYKVVGTRLAAPHLLLSRRGLLRLAAGVTGAAALGGWMKYGSAWRLLHPLPLKRFVALHMWPKPAEDMISIVGQVVGTIKDRLMRAEPRDNQFVVMVANDPMFTGSGSDAPGGEPAQVANALGANLVLATDLRRSGDRLHLTLNLLDPTSQDVLRSHEVSTALHDVSSLGRIAADAAASLLDLPASDHVLADEEEISGMTAEAFRLLAEGKALVEQPNDVGLDAGIEKLQDLANQFSRYAIGYAELANAYVEKFWVTQDVSSLDLAGRNTARALQLNPDSARAILSQAKRHVFLGESEAALAELNHALKLDPMNAEVLLYKASTYGQIGRPAEQEQVFREILTNRPNYWMAYNELGVLLKAEAKYAEAIQVFSTASQIVPRVEMPLTNLGMVYLQMSEHAKASEALTRSIAIHPSSIAYVGLGDMAFEAADYKQAVVNYSRAHDLEPTESSILRDLGDCYSMTHDAVRMKNAFEQAAQVLTQQISINAKDGTNWMTLSFYHAKVGRFDEASRDISAAETRGARDVESQLTKAQTLMLMGHRNEALELVLQCMDRGLAPANVDLAVDLKDIRSDPRYRARVEHRS